MISFARTVTSYVIKSRGPVATEDWFFICRLSCGHVREIGIHKPTGKTVPPRDVMCLICETDQLCLPFGF